MRFWPRFISGEAIHHRFKHLVTVADKQERGGTSTCCLLAACRNRLIKLVTTRRKICVRKKGDLQEAIHLAQLSADQTTGWRHVIASSAGTQRQLPEPTSIHREKHKNDKKTTKEPKRARTQAVFVPNSYPAFVTNSLLGLRLRREMEFIISCLKWQNAAEVNRSLTGCGGECKHLFWERRWRSPALTAPSGSPLLLRQRAKTSQHQFCPERHSAAELITQSQSVSSDPTAAVLWCCRAPWKGKKKKKKTSLKNTAFHSTCMLTK